MDRDQPVDMWLLSALALVGGAIAVVAPAEVAATAAIALGVLRMPRETAKQAVVLVVAASAMGLMRGRTAISRFEGQRAYADHAVPGSQRCNGVGRVSSSPVWVRGTVRWNVDLTNVSCDASAALWSGAATLYGGPEELARGDSVQVVTTLAPLQRFWNLHGGDPRPGEALRGVERSGGALDVRIIHHASGLAAAVDRARALVRRQIGATFAPDLAAMARALVLGENDLAPEDDHNFRASGLSHLLAVSGMHLVLVLTLFVRTSEALLIRLECIAARMDPGRVVAAIGLPITWGYAEFAGAGGSTLRAAWMASAVLAARVLGRRTDASRSFALSLGLMALFEPLVAFDLSFALSAASTAGLLAFATRLNAGMAARLPRFALPIAGAVSTTLAASLPCLPLVARIAPTLPLGGVVANLLAVPVGECAALPLCLVHALLGPCPAAQRGCAIVASGALVVVRAIARVGAAPLLGAPVPEPTSWQLVVIALGLTSIAFQVRRRRTLLAASLAALLALEIHARRTGAPHGTLRATFLDVGQGDAAIVDLPDGEALVVDGGGLVSSPIDVGVRVVAPELRASRRRELALVVLTHPHPDHFGGLLALFQNLRVRTLWDTGQGEREHVGGGYAALFDTAREQGVPVLGPEQICGEHEIGGAKLEVLAPCPTFSSDRGPNDNSFVIWIGYGNRSILLSGDAQREEESLLLSRGWRLRADVLKVAHHGSSTSSTSEFLDAVRPRDAVISVGVRNRFGHPHTSTLSALRNVGARVWRTDLQGAITVETDGTSLDVRAAAPTPVDSE
jgi:competence protein ComEC